MLDRRRVQRVTLGCWTEFSLRDEKPPVRNEGIARDISLGGAFIETIHRCPRGERVLVYLTLPGSRRQMALAAFVRWVDRDGFGVQFGLLTPRDTHDISQYVLAGASSRARSGNGP
jgi:hypothetical protein